jgi:hypothetical protein
MMKVSMALILTLLLTVTAGSVVGEEMAREGSTSDKTHWTGTFDVLPMGEERVQMNYVSYGVSVSDTGKGIFHNASGHVVGGLHAVKGAYEDSGFGSYTLPDGDKVFFTYKASGTLRKSAKGTFTFVGGTGKFVGIQGGGEFTRHSLHPPAKGVFASFTISKGNWKLPEVK